MKKLFRFMDTLGKRIFLSLILSMFTLLGYMAFYASWRTLDIFIVVFVAVPIFVAVTLFYAIASTFFVSDEKEDSKDILDS